MQMAQLLLRWAHAHQRSLGQQALHDLEQLTGGDVRQRRQQALAKLSQLWVDKPPIDFTVMPEDLIRADRQR